MKIARHTLTDVLAARSLQATSPITMEKLGDQIAAYLLEERRTGELDSIIRDIMQYRAAHGIVEVIAVSAFPLSETVRATIRAHVRELYPQATQITISLHHDTAVVGGVRLEFPHQQLDLSIRNKLNRLQQLTGRKER